jgi:hypothetical protein
MPINNPIIPTKTILIGNTTPDYETGVPDTSQTGLKPGLTVYKSASACPNGCTLTGAYHGVVMNTSSSVYSIEIPESNPAFPFAWDIDTAFPAIASKGCSFKMHKWALGDEVWVKTAGVSTTANETTLVAAASGLWALAAAGTTADKWNVWTLEALDTTTSQTWQRCKVSGRLSLDTS